MRRLFIQLPTEDYQRLVRLADHDERSPDRQAAWLLRQKLARVVSPPNDAQPVAAGHVGDDDRAA